MLDLSRLRILQARREPLAEGKSGPARCSELAGRMARAGRSQKEEVDSAMLWRPGGGGVRVSTTMVTTRGVTTHEKRRSRTCPPPPLEQSTPEKSGLKSCARHAESGGVQRPQLPHAGDDCRPPVQPLQLHRGLSRLCRACELGLPLFATPWGRCSPPFHALPHQIAREAPNRANIVTCTGKESVFEKILNVPPAGGGGGGAIDQQSKALVSPSHKLMPCKTGLCCRTIDWNVDRRGGGSPVLAEQGPQVLQ